MPEFVGRHVAVEMVALGLLELLLTFALAYLLLMPNTGGAGIVGDLRAANYALVLAVTVCFIAFSIGLYRSQSYGHARSLILNTVLSAALAFPAAFLVSKVTGLDRYWPVGYDALRPIKILVIWTAALLATRFLFMCAMHLNLFVRRVAVMGPGEMSATMAAIRAGRRGAVELVIPPASERSPAALRRARIRTVMMSESTLEELPEAARVEMARSGISVETEPQFWERHFKRIYICHLTPAWSQALDQVQENRMATAIRRVLDIVTSLAFLLVTLPLMLVIILFVRLDSSGPVLYRQQRVGRFGVPFTLLKFRSMRTDAEARGPIWAQRADPRITRVGSFMRRTRIDELPQLFNVLRGEMSFIGPRPERPVFVEQLAEAIPYYRERNRVKPGLTGWAQVNFPYGASVEDARQKLSYDLYYVKNRAALLDVLILFATIRVILFQEGAR